MSDKETKTNSEAKDLAQIQTGEKKSDKDEDHDDSGAMSMSSFYSLDKPKDALSGTTQGVGNILKGKCVSFATEHVKTKIRLKYYRSFFVFFLFFLFLFLMTFPDILWLNI